VEDTSTIWPLSVETSGSQESITFFEKEVIGNELVLVFLAHTFQWIIGTLKLTSKSLKNSRNELFNLISLFL